MNDSAWRRSALTERNDNRRWNEAMVLQDRLPVSAIYEMNNDNPGQEKSIGFVAQEVKKLFPELVHTSKGKSNGYGEMNELLLMNYSGFGVLAIKGIQEQQEQLIEMKKEIDLLREQNKLLMQLLKK